MTGDQELAPTFEMLAKDAFQEWSGAKGHKCPLKGQLFQGYRTGRA